MMYEIDVDQLQEYLWSEALIFEMDKFIIISWTEKRNFIKNGLHRSHDLNPAVWKILSAVKSNTCPFS